METINRYKLIVDELVPLAKDTLFLSYYIDKIKLSIELEANINFSKQWANLASKSIESMENTGVPISAIISYLKRMLNCTDEELTLIMEEYYGKENITLNKVNFQGKYYRFHEGKIYEKEYVESLKNNQLRWVNMDLNANIVLKYQIWNNTIVATMEGEIFFDFKIINKNIIEYYDVSQKALYKNKK